LLPAVFLYDSDEQCVVVVLDVLKQRVLTVSYRIGPQRPVERLDVLECSFRIGAYGCTPNRTHLSWLAFSIAAEERLYRHQCCSHDE
jgi:hypothetical protein